MREGTDFCSPEEMKAFACPETTVFGRIICSLGHKIDRLRKKNTNSTENVL